MCISLGVFNKVYIKETNSDHFDVKKNTKEPIFFQIAPLVTIQLFDSRNVELPVQNIYLQHIQEVYGI